VDGRTYGHTDGNLTPILLGRLPKFESRPKKGLGLLGEERKKLQILQQIMARWVYSWIVYNMLKTLEWRRLSNTESTYALIKSISTDQMVK